MLQDIHEFALTPDSAVRDEAADIVRRRLRSQSDTIQNGADESSYPETGTAPTVSLVSFDKRRDGRRDGKRKTKKSDVLDKSLRFLAEQQISFNGGRTRKSEFFDQDELDIAKGLRAAWVEESFNCGTPLEDGDIFEWLEAFPHEVLSPRDILPLICAGLKPNDVKLRLWYGRENPGRPTILQRIVCGDMSAATAAAEIFEFRSRTAG